MTTRQPRKNQSQHKPVMLAGAVKSAIVKQNSNTTHRTHKKITKKRLLVMTGLVVIISIVGLWGYNYFTLPAHITNMRFERSLSSRTTDAPVKTSFMVDEPMMLVFDFDSAQPNTSAKLELMKDGKVIRTVELPYLRGDKTAAASGKRFISIVSGQSTRLDVGTYKMRVIANGNRELATKAVEVKQ